MPENPQLPPVFICGTSRSGTTLMKKIFDSNAPHAFPDSEVTFFNVFLPRWKNRKNVDWADALDDFCRLRKEFAPLRDEIFSHFQQAGDKSFRGLFTAIMKSFATSKGRESWAVKCPFLEYKLDDVLAFYPDAKIIYCVRDPEAMALSRKFQYKIDPHKFKKLFVGVPAIDWKLSVRAINKIACQYPGRVITASYEAMVCNRKAEMDKIFSFIGVPLQDEYLIDAERWTEKANTSFPEQDKVDYKAQLFKHEDKLSAFEKAVVKILCYRERAFTGYKDLVSYKDNLDHIGAFGVTLNERLTAQQFRTYHAHILWAPLRKFMMIFYVLRKKFCKTICA